MASDEMLSWLRATIEGDKAAAEAASVGPWEIGDTSGYCKYDITIVGKHTTTSRYNQITKEFESLPTRETIIGPGYEGGGIWSMENAVHVTRHDPRDTIARCEAELRILDEMIPIIEELDYIAMSEGLGSVPFGEPVARLLRLVASGYRHHPGFKPGWVNA